MVAMLRRLGILSLCLGLAIQQDARAEDPPAVGAAAPDFRLQDQDGRWHTLGEYRGRWVVLYFYPKDNTPGCTTQACEFRDDIFAFHDLNAVVLGLSVQDAASHADFAKEHGLPFPLLADPDKKVTIQYGVLTKYLGVVELARRDTFIIDPQGRVAKHYVKVDPAGHAKAVLADLKALGARKVAPAAPATPAAAPQARK
ncbi:MAG: peroxiredoxin [Steroidobacteraceae bacterium]